MVNVKEIEETLEYRLKQVIKVHYGSQKKLAEELGIVSSVISDWWSGRIKPRADILQQICEKTGVSMDWLVLGRAEPYIDDNFFGEIFDASKEFADNNDIKFDSVIVLGMQRIIMAEKRMNPNITIEQVFTKYKEIVLSFRKK